MTVYADVLPLVAGDDDGLTPFVPVLERRVDRSVRELVGTGQGTRLRWRRLQPSGWPIHVALGVGRRPPLELEVHPNDDQPAYRRGRRSSLRYRPLPDGRSPADCSPYASVLEAVGRAFAATEPDTAIVEEVAELVRFDGVADWMFRQLTRLPGYVVGNLRLGFGCNQDCSFCWQGRDWPQPPDELFTLWLEEMLAAQITTLILTGGEPTLHPALPQLVRRARTAGVQVELQTNAVRLARPDALATLVDAGLHHVFVSLHSTSPEISDAMTRAPRTLAKTMAGVEACLRAGLEVSLNCVVESQNVATLPDHAADVVARFVRPFPSNPVRKVTYSHPAAYYDEAAGAAAMVALRDLRGPLVEAARHLRGAGVEVEVLGTCGFPLCLFAEAEDLLRSLPPLAIDPTDRRSRTYPAPCSSCAAQHHCLGPRQSYVERFGSDDLVAFDRDPWSV